MSTSAEGSGVHACGNGPAGSTCHMQISSGAGSDKPNRSKKMNPSGGYHVTSPNPTPSKNKELSSRP